jgi:hypothetical protein
MEGRKRKGVVFYIHGYGCFVQHDAIISDLLNKHGDFEVFAID